MERLKNAGVDGVRTAAFTAALFALVPVITDNPYHLRLGGLIAIYSLLVLGLNVVAGFAGLLDMGYAAFFGIGGYTYAFLASQHFGVHLEFLPALLAGIMVSAAAGMLIGITSLRLRGDYLAILTLGFGQILRLLVINLDRPVNITGGASGIVALDPARILGITLASPVQKYFLAVAMLIIGILAVDRMIRSRLGMAWAAISGDEQAARAAGVNPVLARLTAYVVASGFAGAAGVVLAAWQGSVFPGMFSMNELITVYSMMVLGGVGSIPGAIAGPAILIIVPELLRSYSIYRMVVYGILLVLMMRFRPQGLLPGAARIIRGAKAADRGRSRAKGEASVMPAEEPTVPRPHTVKALAAPALSVENLTVTYQGLTAVDGVSFHVNRGEIVGLIGPNGAGKTTLINAISGFTRPASGRIRVDGRVISGRPAHEIARLGIARTFQNIRLFRGMTVLENAACAAVMAGGHRAGVGAFRGLDALSEMFEDLNGVAPRMPDSLSYPDRRRVEIARALAADPDIVLLDEPGAGMTGGDIEDVKKLVKMIAAQGKAVLLIDHHMDLIMDVCDRIVVLHHGAKLAEGTPEEIRSHPEVIEAYLGKPARGSGDAQRRGKWDGKSGRPGRPPEATEGAKAGHFAGHDGGSARASGMPGGGEPVLRLEGVHAGYGAAEVIAGVDLEIRQGEIVCLVGANAAGKSTLLKAIAGIVRPSEGSIYLKTSRTDGMRRIDGMEPSDILRMGAAFVPEGRQIFGRLTVAENLDVGAFSVSDPAVIKERLDYVYQLFPRLRERANQKAGTLSGGEQQMLTIARALMSGPEILFMDEPTMGLAPVVVEDVLRAIEMVNRAGATVVLVEQNARAAFSVAHRGYVLSHGRIVSEISGYDLDSIDAAVAAYLG